MIHGPLGPVRSVRSHTRRWETLEVGHLFGKFSFESAIFCVRRCPDGSWWQLRKKQHMDTKDTGNLWKSDHQFLTLDCKAGNVMIAKTHPDFPSDICCCWAPWMQSSPSWMPRERLRCLDRNIEHTWTYNFLIKDAKMLMKCVTFFLEISCLVSQRDMPRVVDIISFLPDAKLPRNATCPEHGWAAASQNALASIIRIS